MDKTTARWKKILGYTTLAVVSFAFALRQTVPTEALKERLVMEAAAQGWQVSVADVHPAGFLGVGMTGVTLETREGVRIPIERIQASPRILPLLLGRRGVDFDASLYEGHVRGVAEQGRGTQRVAAKLTGIDLARAASIRKATGLDLGGVLGGEWDVTIDTRDPTKSSGRIDLSLENAAVNGGQVPVPSMGGSMAVPKIAIGTVAAKATVRDGKAVFETLQSKSEDLEVKADGLYFVVQARLAYAPIFGSATVKLRDAFWTRSGTAGFKGVVDMALAQARGRDGAYAFQIFGTASQPQVRLGP